MHRLMAIAFLTLAVLGTPGCRQVAAYGPSPTDARVADGTRDSSLDATQTDAGPASGAVLLIDRDPFVGQPTTDFAFVVKYAGQLYLGPNGTGNGAVRMDSDGSNRQPLVFSLPRDVNGIGATSSNKIMTTPAPPPFLGVGYAGCVEHSYQCGPDNERGRGLFASGFLGPVEWLLLAGAKPGGSWRYVYLTTETDKDLGFGYVDLTQVVGPNTEGISALHVFSGRVYLGFLDTGGQKPYLTQLKAIPPDYVNGNEGIDLPGNNNVWGENMNATAMPAIGDQQQIDAIIDFKDRLYLFNAGGCVRSVTNSPQPYDSGTDNWRDCSPSLDLPDARLPARTSDLTAADKAYPQVAVSGDELYAGFNSVGGPVLLVCSAALGADPQQCESSDWQTLVAPGSGQGQLNFPDNASVALVLAVDKRLYVGFEDPLLGVRIYRSQPSSPAKALGLEGQGGCLAVEANCPGLGGNGLGVGATRIYDAKALTFNGKTDVYVTAGNPVDLSQKNHVSLFRIVD